jgi:hypothetical protein
LLQIVLAIIGTGRADCFVDKGPLLTNYFESFHTKWFAAVLTVLSAVLVSNPLAATAQISSGTNQPAVQPPSLPVTTQIKKTIVFLESDCLHNVSKELPSLSKDKVIQMPLAQQQAILSQLTTLSLRLRSVKISMNKLSVEEAARLLSGPVTPTLSSVDIADEIGLRLQEIVKMTTLTDQEIENLTPAELSVMPLDQYGETGFLVGYVDAHLKPQPGDKGPRYFRYLVTNRHVIQPGIDVGTPCKVVSSYIILNRRPDATHASRYAETDRIDKLLKWTTPQDDSVDLAVTAIGFNETQVDHLLIPTDQFLTDEDFVTRRIVEGTPVLYAGLFIQTFDQVHTLEPIVRSGTLAMIPEGMLQTTLHKMGHIYLADSHVFGGNSGSPIFADPNKFAGIISGPTYKLLGVISGEMFENSDLTLSVTNSVSGNIAANSGVSLVVPVSELIKLLDDAGLKADRERIIETPAAPAPASSR